MNRSRENAEIFNTYLDAVNCTDLACLRSAPLEVLIHADAAVTFNYSTSDGWVGPSIEWGPHPDGDLVPSTPELLLAEGKYHRTVRRVLTANMAIGGLGNVVSKYINTDADMAYAYVPKFNMNCTIGKTSCLSSCERRPRRPSRK